MPLDLSALTARCAALPAGATVTVIIPRGNPVTIGGAVYQEQDTYVIPAAMLTGAQDVAPLPTTATSTLNLRADPERGAALVGQVQAGAAVTVTGAAVGEYAPVTLAGWVLSSGVG